MASPGREEEHWDVIDNAGFGNVLRLRCPVQSTEMPFFPWIQLGDGHRFSRRDTEPQMPDDPACVGPDADWIQSSTGRSRSIADIGIDPSVAQVRNASTTSANAGEC